MFTKKTFSFLKELAANNNREWFARNKDRYEDLVRTPALSYIEEMSVPLARISPHFVASAKKSGGSMMRVYRDTRFGKDKTPYKTNVGIQFRHARGKDVHAPGFYLHLEPGSCFIGAGIWRPESSTLNSVRTMIDEHPAEWKKIRKKVTGKGDLRFGGESLKRAPKGYPIDHSLIDDLKMKDYILIADLAQSDLIGEKVIKTTSTYFKKAAPLVEFICEADDLDY